METILKEVMLNKIELSQEKKREKLQLPETS